jgi:ribosome-binding factor A
VLGSDEDREQALETLQERAFEVQNFVGKELRMRYCPKISFYQDETTEHVLKIDRILHDLEEQKKKQNPSSESDPSDEE